tara:strand:+ start:877 stop:1116 length:240 start_codon:yes stop_codon:yes gene_type:complete
MTPKEFIDENYFSLTIDCKREINEIYQALKDYTKTKQLTLTDVSQQRELLFALLEWIDYGDDENKKYIVESFLKDINSK